MTNDTFRYANAITSTKPVYLRDTDKYEEELATSQADSNADENAEDTQNDENPNSQTDSNNTTDWQKRYSDLQSYSDKKVKAAEERAEVRVQEMQQKLSEAERKPKQYPVSEDEIAAWAAQFPDFYKTLTTVVEKIADSKGDELRSEIRNLENQSRAVAAEKGRQELLKLHPDAFEIEKNPQFIAWLEIAKPRVRALIESPDPYEIAEGLRLFKDSAGIKKTIVVNQEKEASRTVSLSTPDVPAAKKVWKESEVDKMHPRTFAKYEAEIDKARQEGRFDYDLSSM